ncbi:MAG: helix-turn-helix domain-containing protein [Thermoanaerobaculia bacterium]
MPFCHLTFSAGRPILRHYERTEVPEGTLGAAFRSRRWSRGLDQKEAAEEIGVSVNAYSGWETNRREPDLRNMPAAVRFLGSDWRPQGASLGDRIRGARTAAGLSIKQLSALLKTDPSTVGGWESDRQAPSRRSTAKLEEWLHRVVGSELTTS